MAKVEILFPQMGESIVEGTVTKWMKQPGESIAKDETVLEISTDKVDSEVPATHGGVLEKILVQEGGEGPSGRIHWNHRNGSWPSGIILVRIFCSGRKRPFSFDRKPSCSKISWRGTKFSRF